MPKLNTNLLAFLDTIAHSEGTATVKNSDDGYNVEVGGTLFTSYADHPRKVIELRQGLSSSAAGRYQFLAHTFDDLKKKIGVVDFSPFSQDLMCIELFRECHAIDDIMAGRFDDAVAKCAHIWASLPGAGYHQRENSLYTLQQFYASAGGWRAPVQLNLATEAVAKQA